MPRSTLMIPAAPITIMIIPPRVNAVFTFVLTPERVALEALSKVSVGIALYTVVFTNIPIYRNTDPTTRDMTDIITMPRNAFFVSLAASICITFCECTLFPVIAAIATWSIAFTALFFIKFLLIFSFNISNKFSSPICRVLHPLVKLLSDLGPCREVRL